MNCPITKCHRNVEGAPETYEDGVMSIAWQLEPGEVIKYIRIFHDNVWVYVRDGHDGPERKIEISMSQYERMRINIPQTTKLIEGKDDRKVKGPWTQEELNKAICDLSTNGHQYNHLKPIHKWCLNQVGNKNILIYKRSDGFAPFGLVQIKEGNHKRCVFRTVPGCPIPQVQSHYPKDGYKVKVYVRHGYFEYVVNDMEQALAHGEAIMSGGTYRRSTASGDVEIHKVLKVKICGPGLKSEYMDIFKRT